MNPPHLPGQCNLIDPLDALAEVIEEASLDAGVLRDPQFRDDVQLLLEILEVAALGECGLADVADGLVALEVKGEALLPVHVHSQFLEFLKFKVKLFEVTNSQ